MPDYERIVERQPVPPRVAAANAAAEARARDLQAAFDRGRAIAGDAAAPSAPSAAPAMLTLGDVVFAANGAGHQQLRRAAEYRHPELALVGARPARQWTGPGAETIEITGVIHPGWRGSADDVAALRAAAIDAAALRLVDGTGRNLGLWAVLRVDETWTALLADGLPRRIEFSLELALAGVDEPSGLLGDAAANAAANGSAAPVVSAAATAAAGVNPLVDTAADGAAAVESAARAAADGGGVAARQALDAVLSAVSSGPAAMARAAARAALRTGGGSPLGRLAASTAYRAADGDVLDDVAWRRYGAEAAVHQLLAANPDAAVPRLDAGQLIGLPDVAPPRKVAAAVQLWS